MSDHLRVRFQDAEYILVGGDLTKGGPIATPDAFANFRVSYAHLMPDGIIRRYGAQIGTRDDIEVLGPDDTRPTPEGMATAFGWLLSDDPLRHPWKEEKA